MSYTDKKITQEEINAHHVQGATDYLIGNPQQNKAVFDNLPEFIAGKFNDLIDEIAGHHGDEIKVAVDEWLAEHPEATTTVQDNSLTTAKYVDGSVTEPKIGNGAVTPSKLDRAYSTSADLALVNANLTNELNVLDARMDEFASLPEGSTSGNAELLDIRVGEDGETYPSAGGAVRGQVADLKSDISEIEVNVGETLLATNKDFTESTIYLSTGSTTTISHRTGTDFIPCDKFEYVEFKLRGLTGTNNLAIVAWFDSNKTFLRCYASPTGNAITGVLPVPSDAYYLKGVIVDNDGINDYFIKGVYKDSLIVDNKSMESASEANDYYANIDLPVKNHFLYDTTGALITASQRYSCYPVDISAFDYLEISASERASLNLNAVSFLDADLVYLSGVASTTNAVSQKIVAVPNGAKYAVIPFQDNASGQYMHGIKSSSLGRRLKTVELVTGKDNSAVPTIVNPTMTRSEFQTALWNALDSYATFTGCSRNSFFGGSIADVTWDAVYSRLNKIFRDEVYVEGLPHEVICDRVNHAFAKNIWMWKDAKYNDGTPRDFSLAFSERSGEPSAIVSPDGGTLYVYGYNGRWSTNDGLHWSDKEALIRTGLPTSYAGVEHANTNYIDGIYYMVGALNVGDRGLALLTSTDGITFEYKGIMLNKTDIIVDGESIMNWGNSYIVKDGNTYYLYIEGKLTNNANFWDIYLCTCTDPLLDNGDGTVGNWVYSGTGAIVGDLFNSPDLKAHGNPDFAKGPDNKPIRIDGYWYMYYHVTYNGAMIIYRAKSSDLITWTVEGPIINNRDVPTAGESSAGNADHALIEFKGKTYLFYTWDINSQYTPYIKYVVDDRPFRELLKMYP